MRPRSGGIAPCLDGPWSPRRWLARHVGCRPGKLHIAVRSDKSDGSIVVTYVTDDGELLTVLAVLDTAFWRIDHPRG